MIDILKHKRNNFFVSDCFLVLKINLNLRLFLVLKINLNLRLFFSFKNQFQIFYLLLNVYGIKIIILDRRFDVLSTKMSIFIFASSHLVNYEIIQLLKV